MDKKKRGKKAAKKPAVKRKRKAPPKKSPKPVVKKSPKKKAITKRAHVKKPSKKAPPPARKLAPMRSAVSVRKLPVKYRGLAQTLKDLEENADEIDRLKKPNEYWGFELADGIRSYALYPDIALMAQELGESAGIQFLYNKHQKASEFWRDLKIIRWNKSATEWKPTAQKLTANQLERRRRKAARQAKRRNTKRKR